MWWPVGRMLGRDRFDNRYAAATSAGSAEIRDPGADLPAMRQVCAWATSRCGRGTAGGYGASTGTTGEGDRAPVALRTRRAGKESAGDHRRTDGRAVDAGRDHAGRDEAERTERGGHYEQLRGSVREQPTVHTDDT